MKAKRANRSMSPGRQPLHEAAHLDPAWLDAQYNPMTAVRDPGMFQRWGEESARTRQSLACRLDLPYGVSAAPDALETLDVFHAAKTGSGTPAPVLVFVHGGYWRGSDKNVYSFLAAPFVAAGITVVMPNYPLCPSVTIDDIAISLTKALRWVHAHIGDHGGDAARISVMGHSAGGHLVAMLLACHWHQVDASLPPDVVKKALAISGLFELEPFRHATFLAKLVRLTQASVMRLSPARLPPPPAGRELYAVVGADEPHEFHRQNALIAERWGSERVPVCEAIPQRDHFTILDDLLDPSSRLHQLALRLVG